MTKHARAREGLRLTGVVLASALWILSASPAAGRERDFFPEFSKFEGDLEMGLAHERFKHEVRGRGASTEDSTAVERLRLGALGYMYHPRFITFKVKGAFGLRQEYFDSDEASTVRSGTTTEEYDLRAWFLPEHAYSLEAYAARRNPLLLGRFAPGSDTVSYDKGAVARYLKMPWSLEAGVSDASTSGRNTTAYDSRTKYASASSFLGPTTTTVSYSHVFTTQQGTSDEHDRNRYYVSNQISLPRLTLNSRVEDHDEEQRGVFTTASSSDRRTWNEDLSVLLPAGFSAGASYAVYRDVRTTLPALDTVPEQSYSRAESSRFTVSHRLYASLRTSYNKQYIRVDSSTGESDTDSESLNALYSKIIPGGRMTMGGFLGKTEQTRSGAPVFLSEQHDISVPGSFLLQETRVDVSTVSVRVQDPSGSLVLLDPVHYLVRRSGPGFEVFIVNLPPPFVLGTSYRFEVDYAMVPAEVEIEIRHSGYNLAFQLLDGRVNPYYTHTSSEQEVVSGTIPGGPDSVTSDTVGLQLGGDPFTFLGEYTNYRSRTSPFESWRASADVRGRMGTGSVNGRLFHSRTQYDDSAVRTVGYSDELTEVSLQFLRTLPEAHLNLSAGGSCAFRRTFANTQSYSANAAVLWRLGELEARGGVTTVFSSSSLPLGRQRSYSNYYYLTVTRHLF